MLKLGFGFEREGIDRGRRRERGQVEHGQDQPDVGRL
jgi:hypothetical protein